MRCELSAEVVRYYKKKTLENVLFGGGTLTQIKPRNLCKCLLQASHFANMVVNLKFRSVNSVQNVGSQEDRA